MNNANDVPSSQIQPGRVEKKEVPLSDVEDYLISNLSKIDPRFYSLYDTYKVKNNSYFFKDYLKNYEQQLKNNNIDNPETVSLIGKIFECIYLQLNILQESNGINKVTNSEAVLIASSTLITHLKKIF